MVKVILTCYKCGKKFKHTPDLVSIVKEAAEEMVGPKIKDIIIEECPRCNELNRFDIPEMKLSSDNEEPIHIVGKEPSEKDTTWIDSGKEYLEKSPSALNTIAKDMVALDSALITAYIAALTFLKIPKVGVLSTSPSLTIVALPIIFWLVSLFACAYAYHVKIEDVDIESVTKIKKALNKTISSKSDRISVGYGCLAIGLIAAAAVIGGSDYRTTTSDDVQFVVGSENIPIFENMSLIEDNMTMITIPVTLIDESDSTYTIRKDDGEIIVFNKDKVVGVKYSD